MSIIAVALFAISTWDVAIGILHLFHAFIRADNAKVELENIADWINIARVCFSLFPHSEVDLMGLTVRL